MICEAAVEDGERIRERVQRDVDLNETGVEDDAR